MLTSRYADVDGLGARAHLLLQRRLPAHPRRQAPLGAGRAGSDEVWAEIWHDIGPRIGPVLATAARPPGRRAAAVPGAQRLSRGDLPHVLLQPDPRRRRRASAACSASSPRRPSASSASGGSRTLRELAARARPKRADRRRCAAERSERSAPTRAICRSRCSICSSATARRARLAARRRHRGRPSGSAGDRSTWPTASSLAGRRRCWRRATPMLVDDLPSARRAADRRLGRAAARRRCVVPDRAGRAAGAAGFLVVGLNPYRPFDEAYRGFVDLRRRPDRGASPTRAPTSRSAAAPRRSPSSTAPRRRSSPTSATSSARRSR